jgi:hypothetical protein
VEWAESGPRLPVFRVRLAAGSRMLIEAAGDPVLIAKVLGCWEDICLLYADADRRLEVLPAWTAAECRRFGDDQDRWLFEIRRRLRASPLSPLHSGEWALSGSAEPWVMKPNLCANMPGWPRSIPGWPGLELADLDDEPGGATSAQICVFGELSGWKGWVVPLRRLSAPDGPRVKAHRRLAREGVLAPAVLLTVSGLCGYVILDGHDRLAAAMAEDVRLPLVFLTRAGTGARVSADKGAVSWYEHTMDAIAEAERGSGGHVPGAGKACSRAAMRLAATLDHTPRVPTLAWPLSADEWERAAARVSPAWLPRLSDG